MKVIAQHDKRNYMVVRDDLTRAHRRRMLAAVAENDSEGVEAVLRETIMDVQIAIGDEVITGLDNVMAAITERDDIPAQVDGFWANAWFSAYRELQRLGEPKPAP